MRVVESDLALRDFEESDINDTYLGWLNDVRLMQFSNQRFSHHDHDSSCEYLASMKSQDNLFFAILLGESRLLAGTVTAHINRNHSTANLGILIGEPSVRGKGVGRRVWLTFMNYLFDELEIRKLCAGTLEPNKPMNRLAIATNMQLEGVLAAQELVDGSPVNMNLYGKFRD